MVATPSAEFISELINDITEAAASSAAEPTRADAHAIKADLNTLCEQIVHALTNRREDIIAGAYADIERGYTKVAASSGIDEQTFDARATAAELRGLTRLLGTAMQYRRMPEGKKAVQDNRKLLEILHGSAEGISGRDLAKRLAVAPETVARKLPYLRSAGLVRSHQVGRTMVNRLTPESRRLVEELWAEEHAETKAAEPVTIPDPWLLPDGPVAKWKEPVYIMGHAFAPGQELVPERGRVIARRAAQISGTTVRIDPAPVLHPYGHRAADLTVKHEKVSAGTGVTVEVIGMGTEPGIQSMSQYLMGDGMVTGLCQMNKVAGKEGTKGLFVRFDPDNSKIVAQVIGQSDENNLAAYEP